MLVSNFNGIKLEFDGLYYGGNYEIEVLDIHTNILIEAIWTGNSASTSKLIKKININGEF